MTALGAGPHSVARRRGQGRALRGGVAGHKAPPDTAAGLVGRPDLVERLTALRGGSVALLVAPAGYGKSALLSQWAAVDPRRFASVRLTAVDDDPAELLRSIARAVAELDERVGAAAAQAEDSRGRRSDAALERALLAALSDPELRCVIALDDAHVLQASETTRALAWLVDRLGPGVAVALASRSEPTLPVARLRAGRRLVELRAHELALTRTDVARLVATIGLELEPSDVEVLARRTEGWAAGVYLAALAARESRTLAHFGGNDRVVADYVREEMLAGLPDRVTDFLVRTSILDRLTGPICDHVLGRRDSAATLRRLSRVNLLLLPLDRTDTEYRYHPLFAEALRSELGQRRPEVAQELHTRAADWYQQRGDRASAIDHVLAAGDINRAGRLLWAEAPALLAYGHCAKLNRQLRRFSREEITSTAPLALTAASTQLAMGDRALVEHWISAAARVMTAGELEGQYGGGMLAMRAAVSDASLTGVRDEAARAYELSDDASPWRAVACLVEGAARHLTGDRDGARTRLDEGARRGALAPAIQVLCLGQLALLAIDAGDWDAAESLSGRAQAQIERVQLGDYPTAALAFAASAAVQARLGHLDACDAAARHANRLLSELDGFTAWFTAECRIALAWSALRLGEQRTARRLLDEATYDLRLHPQATVAHDWLATSKQQLDAVAGARSIDAEPLTKAELRVLQYLPTHLSFLEIAEHLYVSTNTVKTHARALYRKLAASSRSEAVLHARQAGLLEGSA